MGASSVYFENNEYDSETFNDDGTFEVPAGINLVFVEMWGGGGGGSEPAGGGDQGAGGLAGKVYVGQISVTPEASTSVTIGSGGIGNTGGGDGGDGGDTSFANIHARGGDGGPSNIILPFSSDSFRAVSGADDGNFGGGDGGFADGGDGVGGGTGEVGGIGAGGGAGSVAGGNGGAGICIIYWKIS